MKDLAKDAFDEWYKLCAASGVALAIAALAAGHAPLLIVAIGLVFTGLGEFINHPFQCRLEPNPFGFGVVTISGRARRNKPIGLAIVIAGGAMVALGIIRLLAM